MNTPIFDALLAESDDTTRALVWDAVTPAIDLGTYIERMNRFGRALAQLTAVEPEPELQHPGTWLPGDQVEFWDGEEWERRLHRWRNAEGYRFADDKTVDSWLGDDARIHHLVPRTNGGE